MLVTDVSIIWFVNNLSHKYLQNSITKHCMKVFYNELFPQNYLTNITRTIYIRSANINLKVMSIFHNLNTIHTLDITTISIQINIIVNNADSSITLIDNTIIATTIDYFPFGVIWWRNERDRGEWKRTERVLCTLFFFFWLGNTQKFMTQYHCTVTTHNWHKVHLAIERFRHFCY